MGKINIHCHTKYSDGANTIEEMAIKHKELGFDACVITDHLYLGEMFLDKKSFIEQKSEIEEVSRKINYPIIQGIELNLYFEEVIVIGEFDLLISLFDINTVLERVHFIHKNKDKLGIILCHPSLNPARIKSEYLFYDTLFDTIDGFEEYNSGCYMFKNREIIPQLLNKKAFSNSDAHHIDYVYRGGNTSKTKIIDTEELIKFIKNG